jgi:hypothetical protein
MRRGHEGRKRSWWRSVYDRVSHSHGYPSHRGALEDDIEDDKLLVPARQPQSPRSRSPHRHNNSAMEPLMYDDPPPPSAIRRYRGESRSQQRRGHDVLESSRQPYPSPALALPYSSSNPISAVPLSTPHARSQPSVPQRPRPSIERSDSLLQRVFPHSAPHSDVASSENQSLTASSSQSHAIRGGPRREIITRDRGAARMAEIIPAAFHHSSLSGVERDPPNRPSHHRDSAHIGSPFTSTPPPTLAPATEVRGSTPRDGARMPVLPSHSPRALRSPRSPPRHKAVRSGNLVMPALLASPANEELASVTSTSTYATALGDPYPDYAVSNVANSASALAEIGPSVSNTVPNYHNAGRNRNSYPRTESRYTRS